MQLGVSTWEAAGFLGMSEKTLRVVYDHRIRCPVHTTSLIFGVAKFPQSSTNYADQFSDTSGESHRQRAPECHSDLGSQNVCAACPYDTVVPAIVEWSSVMKLTPQRLHLKTLTSGSSSTPGIVRATTIGREQFGQIGDWACIVLPGRAHVSLVGGNAALA